MSGGTVNISRELWDDTAFRNEPFTQREAWIWMIAEASWKERDKPVGPKWVKTARGQMACSLRFLAKAWGWTDPRVRRYLDMLENRRMISRVSDAHATLITICKYDEYQNGTRVGDAPTLNKPTHERRTGDANDKKGERRVNTESTNVLSSSRTKSNASRLPDDWVLPREWGDWALSQGWSDIIVRDQADRFRDYWVAAPGQRGVKRDWLATWRNWMRNSKSPRTINGGSHEQPASKSANRIRAWTEGARGTFGTP